MSACAARKALFQFKSVLPGKVYDHKCVFNLIVMRKFSTQLHERSDADKLPNVARSPWTICAAVCLVRLPALEEELTDFEKKYAALKDDVEFETSVLNNWELEKQRQLQLIKDVEAGKKNPEDVDFSETNQDQEDKFETAFNNFIEHNQEQDEVEDYHNINRLPRHSLILLTQMKLGKDMVWMLPSLEWIEDESLRECAERTMKNHCGNNLEVDFVSNAPSGFYKYKFPKALRCDSRIGAKMFIYNAFVNRNFKTASTYALDLEKSDEIRDYAWVSKQELKNFLKPKLLAAVKSIVL